MLLVGNPISVVTFVLTSCAIFISATMNNKIQSKRSSNLEEFHYCMKQSQHPRLQQCIGRTALNFLQRFDEKDNYTIVDDFIATKDDKISARSLINILDTDPIDFRGILENAGAVFSQRSFEWHMDNLYPGLMLKIGPTADANSVAEFIVDHEVSERQFLYQEPSTARILAKQYLLPFLLGLKFNLVALVPLLFAGICLLLKKSLFLAKVALYVSSFLGVGGVASILGGLGGIGAGLGGAFGGAFGGPAGSLTGFGIGPNVVRGHGVAAATAAAFDDVASNGGQTGYFPGKTTVFNQHHDANGAGNDELYHAAPYKRNERKINFNKPREYVGADVTAANLATSTAVADRFYEYEKEKLIQDRSSKLRLNNGKLGPSAAYDNDEREVDKIFKPSEQFGWKVLDIRV